jgi:PAS domain S-box-containing protein
MKTPTTEADLAKMPEWQALQRHNAILQAVSYGAEQFLGSKSVESVLTDVLEKIGKAAEVGSATVFEFDNDPEQGVTLVPRYSWTTAGAVSVFEYAPQGFSLLGKDFERLLALLQSGKPVVARIGSLPKELRAQVPSEVRALAALAIFAGGEPVGVITLSQRWSEREWSESELGALKTAATVIGAALERNQSRRAVRKRDELLRLFFEHAPLMVAYFDGKRQCRFANQRYAGFFGTSGRDVIGMALEDIMGIAEYKSVQPYLDRCFENNQVAFERTHADPGGNVRYLDVQLIPHQSGFGETVGFFKILADITERRKNEEDMRRVALENASILENTVSGIAHIKDRHIVRCNRSFAALFGYEPEDIQGRPTRLIHVSEECYRQQGEDIYPQIEAIGHATGIVQNRKKDGPIIWTHFSATALDRSDMSKGVIWVANDITEQINAQAALREAHDHLEEKISERTEELAALNRELEAYSYSVSHDLRAPLRAIDGFTHLLEERLDGKLDREAGEYLGKVRSSIQRMFRLIEALMELGRVSRKGMNVKETDLSACAREIAADIAPQDSPRRVEFVIEDGIRTAGDPQLLRLLLQNLLENAWKYTAKTAAARIEFDATRDASGRRVYRIRDNGAGFDMAYAARLFQPFQRLHSAHEFEGSGIGLATVARIVGRHGGAVWAEAAPGQGAAFMFTLAESPPPGR